MALKVYQHLAECFVAEGTRALFVLSGDGNMHWATDMETRLGVRTVHVRHEHCALGAAAGYHSATGEVGVASVTCGPGYMQTLAALTSTTRSRVPLVVFAGESPLGARWYNQHINQSPFATLIGAHYIAAHAVERMNDYVREAFYVARRERRPVVLGVPYDLQKRPMPDGAAPYRTSLDALPRLAPPPPDEDQVAELAALLAAAERPVFLAGLGALRSGAGPAVERLADQVGALLATTLPARGMFDHHPFSLGVCGGFARPASAAMFAEADLVVSFGASHAYQTLHGGRMFPNAEVVQVSLEPSGLLNGLVSADRHVAADVSRTIAALSAALDGSPVRAAVRSNALAKRLRETRLEGADEPVEAGTLNPVNVFEELEAAMPGGFHVVSGSGHQSYYHTTMRGADPERYHHIRAFGAIGFSLSQTIGVAAAAGSGEVVLYEGDGSLMMYAGEFDTIARHGLKLLIVCINDGAFGSEVHKLRADGLPTDGVVFGRPDFAAIARGFGLRGATITEPGQFARLLAEYQAGETAMVWDVHVSDAIMSPSMRQSIKSGHGVR